MNRVSSVLFAAALSVLSLRSDCFAAPPNAPSNLGVGTPTSSSLHLTWTDNSGDEEGFKVERKEEQGQYQVVKDDLGPNVVEWTDPNLSEGTKYIYRVFAHKGGENSTYSNEADGTTRPTAPSNPAATVVSHWQVDLSWQDNSSKEDLYRVDRKPDGGAYALVKTLAKDKTSWSDTGLSEGTKYYYRIYAVKGTTLNSAYSDEVNSTTKPKAPSSLTTTVVSSTQIDLSWQDNSGVEEGFKIEMDLDPFPGSSWQEIDDDEQSPYSSVNLFEGTRFYYRVCAYKGANKSEYTDMVDATTKPQAPSNLTATVSSSSQINLGWTDNSQAEDAYKVERKAEGESTYSEVQSLGANEEGWNDTGLNEATKYYYKVSASKYGQKSDADLADATTKPNAPTNLAATPHSSTRIDLTWTDNSTCEEGFKVERKPDTGGDYQEVADLGENVVAWTNNTGLSEAAKYHYRVCAYKGTNKSAHVEANATTKPGAPTNLRITNIDADSLKLDWDCNSTNATGYKIERKSGGGNFSVVHTVAGAGTSTWQDDSRTTGTEYTYRVFAYKDGGPNSDYSNEAKGTPNASTEVWPVAGAGVGYTYCDYFDNYLGTSTDYHWGVDILAAAGTDVEAPFTGTIQNIGGAGTQQWIGIRVGAEYVTLGHLQNRPFGPGDVGNPIGATTNIGEIGANAFGAYGAHTHIDPELFTVWFGTVPDL